MEEDLFCRRDIVGQLSESYRLFNLIFFIAGYCLTFMSVWWWIKNKKRYYLQVRSTAAMFLNTAGFMVGLLQPYIKWRMDKPNFMNRCSTTYVLFSLSMFLFTSGISVHHLLGYYKTRLIENVIRQYVLGPHKANRSDGRQQLKHSTTTTSSEVRSQISQNPEVNRRLYRSSQKFLWKLSFCLVIGSFIISFTIVAFQCPEFGIVDCNGRRQFIAGSGITAVMFFVVLLIIYVIRKKTKEHPDPFELQKELIEALFVNAAVTFSLSTGFLLTAFRSEIATESASLESFDFTTLVDLTIVLLYIRIVPYQVYVARKYPNSHYNLKLADVLRHPSSRELFHQYLISEYSAPNLSFWMAVQHWRETYATTAVDVRQANAKALFKTYFAPESLSELNVGYFSRQALADAISAEHEYSLQLFDKVEKEVFKLMEDDLFFRFKMSNLYMFYMGLGSKQKKKRIKQSPTNVTENLPVILQTLSIMKD